MPPPLERNLRKFLASVNWTWVLEAVLLLLILAGFLSIELGLYRVHAFPFTRRETDGIDYLWLSQEPLTTVNEFHGPGFPLAIRLVRLVIPDAFSAAKLVSIFFGGTLLVLTWLLGRQSDKPFAGILAGGLILFSTTFLSYSVTILSDIMAAALFLGCLVMLLLPKNPAWIHYFLAGILAGAAYLTRSVYIVLLLAPVIALLARPEKEKPTLKVFRLGTFLLGVVLITAPWLVVVAIEKGNPFWNHNYYNLAFKMYRGAEGWNAFSLGEQYSGWLDVIRTNPRLFLSGYLDTLRQFPGAMAALLPAGLLSLVGFFLWCVKMDWRRLVLLGTALALALLTCLVWLDARFLLAFLPLMALWLTELVYAIPPFGSPRSLSRFWSGFIRHIPWRGLAILLLLGTSLLSLTDLPAQFTDQAGEYQAAAAWIKAQHADGEASILAAKPHIAFYSDSRYLYFRDYDLQDKTLADLPEILAELNPTYMVYDERYAAGQFPQFQPLLDPQTNPFPELLKPVLVIDQPARLVVYSYQSPQGN